MTQLDVLYRFGAPPSESAMMAISRLREVYGIRRVTFNERDRVVGVEYDASRLTEPVVHKLLRGAGLDIIENVSLVPATPPPATAETAPSAAAAKP